MKSDLIDMQVNIRRLTDLAALVDNGSDEPVWLPLAAIELEPYPGAPGYSLLTLPEWLALEKGLI